eukprot:TRINITY_DN4060_c1_g1_i2.p1 TRINITY_DN4060_c1_g1~~TRINITY_DN4060_c1_g1_i2.p1  ORF type:complete len:1010 (+),score=235.23 TRINITY_DN4060_c1_g1_i2:192-3221(+)
MERTFHSKTFVALILLALVRSTTTIDYVCEEELEDNFVHQEEEKLVHLDGKSHIVEDEYIVTFRRYMPLKEHQSFLTNILGTSNGWSIVPRPNAAWFLPSDFSLIKIADYSGGLTLDSLRRSAEVRHVVPQRRFVGSLKGFEEPEIVSNQTGRMHAKFPEDDRDFTSPTMRRLHSMYQIPELFNAQYLWDKQYTGTGIRVAVFDTGLQRYHPHFRNVIEIKNWTDEDTSDDGIGHGTFVTGVIASQSECLGFAPDVDIYVFRVFTNNRVSYTSWFLDAFNYAILTKIDVLNLSIGGPDFMDLPFVEKVWELSANNIIVVSAIGNDGPLYGTLNNPADQFDVIGVGGIDFGEKLAAFSSRGMTTWELPEGYGRVKPDILAYGHAVQGSRINGGCKTLSGTSVASPVVAGAVALLASTVPEHRRKDVINPASMKQVLVGGAERIPGAHIFEQGFGKLNLMYSYELLQNYVPHASCLPSSLDLTSCPYMWPYCTQPIYYSALPLIVNVTVLNGMGVTGEIEAEPVWTPGRNGEWIEIAYNYPEFLWPYGGYLGLRIRVRQDAEDKQGDAEGIISFTVTSPPGPGEVSPRKTKIELPLKVRVIQTPSRNKRLLWDQYHNLRYPSGYFPRDSLDNKEEPFDWNGDHIHTNFKELYGFLREKGYFIEVLGSPYTCFNASNYGTLLIVDTEEEFFPAEVKKLTEDVQQRGLSVLVLADWYNAEVMKKINFFDENTRQWWFPVTGGSNVPALNDLLNDLGVAFSDQIYAGEFEMTDASQVAIFSSGVSVARFPPGGSLASFVLNDQNHEVLSGKGEKVRRNVPVLGLYPTSSDAIRLRKAHGRIAVYGDSSGFDDSNKRQTCLWLIEHLLNFTNNGVVSPRLSLDQPLERPFIATANNDANKEGAGTALPLPKRLDGTDLHKFSKVIGRTADCKQTDFRWTNRTEGEPLLIVWEDVSQVGSTSGRFREESFSRVVRQNGFTGNVILPTILGCILVIAIFVFAVKTRQNRTFSKRFLV